MFKRYTAGYIIKQTKKMEKNVVQRKRNSNEENNNVFPEYQTSKSRYITTISLTIVLGDIRNQE